MIAGLARATVCRGFQEGLLWKDRASGGKDNGGSKDNQLSQPGHPKPFNP
jgi:hypothetical protein